MVQIRSLFAILSVAIVAIACSPSGPGPEKVLQTYFDHVKALEYDQAHALVSEADRAAKPLAAYRAEGSIPMAAAMIQKTTFKVLTVSTEGDKANAQVEITTPDAAAMLGNLFGNAMAAALGGGDAKDLEKQAAEKLGSENLPMRTEKEQYKLVREKDGWRVFMNWEQKAKIEKLTKAAESLAEQKKYAEAAEKYGEILALDAKKAEIEKKRDEMLEAAKVAQAKREYLAKVELYDLKAKRYQRYSGDAVPGVEFKLRNKGDRELRKVEVTVYFNDANGNTIAEERYMPVLVTDFGFSRQTPLKPNYIWELEKGRFYNAKSVPSEWKVGAARAEVTDIDFVTAK